MNEPCVCLQREFNHSGTAEMSAKANNNRQAANKSYAGPTATEEARAAAKKVRNRAKSVEQIVVAVYLDIRLVKVTLYNCPHSHNFPY